MGKALMRSFVDEESKRMPHKSMLMKDATTKTLLAITNTYKQVDILHDVNKTIESMSLQLMSSSTFNRIWKKEFIVG